MPFGQTLFGRSGFIRWALTPFVLIFAILMPLCIDNWTPVRVVLMLGMELMCLALLSGFWLPARFGHWAFRGVAALVFLAYSGYVIHEFFFTDARFNISSRRSEASPLNALLGFLIIGLPSLLFALRGRFTMRAEASPEQLAADREACEERILRPDWEFYERHLQRPAPAALRELYADRAFVTAGGLDYDEGHGISTFEALDEQCLLNTRELAGCDVVAFATSECGDPIYLRPGPSEPDKVYITHHDGGDTEVFAESVATMLDRLRKANRAS